jgi:hypothetical protein
MNPPGFDPLRVFRYSDDNCTSNGNCNCNLQLQLQLQLQATDFADFASGLEMFRVSVLPCEERVLFTKPSSAFLREIRGLQLPLIVYLILPLILYLILQRT